jgi:hypothetical protein
MTVATNVTYDGPLSLSDIQEQHETNVRLANRAEEISVSTGMSPDEVYSKTSQGDTSPIQVAKEVTTGSLGATLNKLQETQVDDPLRILSEQAQKIAEVNGTSDYYLEGALTYDDPNFSPVTVRSIVNLQIAAEEIEVALREVEEDTSFFGYVTDFADRYLLRQIPIGAIEEVTNRTGRSSDELLEAASTLSPEEYREYIRDYVEDLKSEGFFKSENYFALGDGLREVEKRGYTPEAHITALLGLSDLVGAGAISAISRIAKLRGPVQAARAYTKAASAGVPNPSTLTAAGPSVLNPGATGVGVTQSVAQQVTRQNDLIRKIEGYTKIGSFGRRVTKNELDKQAIEIKDSLEARLSRSVADWDIEDRGLGEYFATAKIGKAKDGQPFSTYLNAAKQANHMKDRGLQASYEAVDPNDLNKGYYVVVREPIDQSRIGRELEIKHHNIVGNSIARVIGSTRSRDDAWHGSMAGMTEGAKSLLVKESKPYLKSLNKLSVEDQEIIGSIYKELRDGSDSHMRRWYTESEFKDKWRTMTGEAAEQKHVDAYFAGVTLNDTAWILKANALMRNYVRHGYKALDVPGQGPVVNLNTGNIKTIMAQPATEFDSTDLVLDLRTGAKIPAGQVPSGLQIWRTTNKKGPKLVIKPNNVRAPEYRDVLAYNAGGNRINPDANFFVVFGSKNRRGTAMMTAYSSKQAAKAVEELSAIRRELLSTGRPLATLTNQLDNVIANNNTWNPSIENTADLIDLAQRKGWDFSEEISFRARGDTVEAGGDLWDNTTYEFFTAAGMKRSDESLMQIGGQDTFNFNPIKDIVDQLSDTFNEYAFKNYTESAKVSFVQTALGTKKLPNQNLDTMFDTLLEGLKSKASPTVKERELIGFGDIIRRRTHYKSAAVRAMEQYGQELSEFVFDKTKRVVRPGDPTDSLLRLGFQSAFGFGNISQFIMQGSQVGSIVAISPVHGLRASVTALPLRLAMASDSVAGKKSIAKLLSMSDAEVDEVFDYLRSSGRLHVESDAIEKNIGPGMGISGFNGSSFLPTIVREGLYRTSEVGKKTLDVGLTPFREGEKLSRLTGLVTSILEYKAKNPGVSILSDSARTVIANREQLLTFDMTTAMRGAFQTGLMRLPTQWLSYSFRAMENVILGRDLTKFERFRLGTMLSLQGGLAGFGLFTATDELADWLGIEPDSIGFTTLKYGTFDGILSYAFSEISDSDVRTAMGSRLAPLTTFFDIHRRITEDEAWEALGGPSTSIIVGAGENLLNAIGDVYHGRYTAALEDVEKVARTASGVDNVFKAQGILQYQTYRSKTGSSLDFEFDDMDGYLAAMGISNFKVIDYYERRTRVWRDTKYVRDLSRRLSKEFKDALLLEKNDYEGAATLIKQIEASIQTAGLSPAQENEVRRALRQDTSLDSVRLVMDMLKRENEYGAKVVESYTRGNQ